MKSEAKTNFDEVAATWDENPVRVKLALDIAEAMKNLVKPTADMDVMDFGCGTGLMSLQFQTLVHSISGVDSSEGMLDVFNSKISALNTDNIQTRLVDLEQGESLSGSYDLILSSMTFHHIKDISGVLAHFHKCLRPGGTLCIADLDREDGKFHSDNTGIHHFGFDRKELGQLFEKADFTAIQSVDATEVEKTGADGISRTFPVFIISGTK